MAGAVAAGLTYIGSIYELVQNPHFKTLVHHMSKTEFSTLNLPASMLKTLESLKYHSMTEIQEQSLPLIIDKKDIGQAKTGSGKTAAFGIGTVTSVDPVVRIPRL